MKGRAIAGVIALVLAACAAVLGYRAVLKDGPKTRAENILNGMKHGYLEGEWQTAAAMWYAGMVRLADQKELEYAVDGFEAWLRQARIRTPIAAYEIVEVTLPKGDPPSAFVTVRIDGDLHRMRIVKDEAVSWADGAP